MLNFRTTFFSMRLLIFGLMLSTMTMAQSTKKVLRGALNDYFAQLPAEIKINIQVESLRGKVYVSQGADEAVPSASVIKIPILVELMEQVKAGKHRLDEKYILRAEDKTGGSGIIANYADGTEMTTKELARLMMVASDNTATNVIIQKVGREAVNHRMKALGFEHLQLNRVMMDTASVARGIDNYVSMHEINELLRLIFNDKVATPALCEQIRIFLFQNEDRTTLPRWMPENVKVAHKTGGLTYVRGDAGVVFTEKPFAISVFVRGTTTEKAEEIIGQIGKICYDGLH